MNVKRNCNVKNNRLQEIKSVEQRVEAFEGLTSRFDSIIFSRLIIALGILFVFTASLREAKAQTSWRKKTPRDTVFVPADTISWTPGHIALDQNVVTKFYLSSTFGIFHGQNGTGFDARYTYQVPGWNFPSPLKNPPSWNNTNYQVYLEITADDNPADSDSIRVEETSYQPTHKYTALYPSAGSAFEFRIYDRLSTPPYGLYYDSATGGINIYSAQYTPGISVQYDTLNFPLTNVGSTNTLVDSIASYGEDTLVVDSVWIGGPTASDFRIVSQNGNYFTLPGESANKFSVLYSPSTPQPSGEDTLYIRSSNADAPDRLRKIFLFGSGAAPNSEITPGNIDFGLERVGFDESQNIIAFNLGNGYLIIDSIVIVPDQGTKAGIFVCGWPAKAFPDSIRPFGQDDQADIPIQFWPAARQPYQATALVYTNDGKVTPVTLNGQGAAPVFDVLDSILDFDTVFTYDKKVLYDTIRNNGNWTEHVTQVGISGGGSSYFSFQPAADTNGFFLDAGDSIIFTITFHPSTTTDAALNAEMLFYFKDATNPAVITLFGDERRPRIVYDTNFIDFGLVKIGDTKPKSVNIKNGSGVSQPFYYQIAQNPAQFQVTGPNPNIFGFPADSLSLGFTPTVHGPASAWLYIQCNEQQDSVYMTGFGGIARPVFTPDTVYFPACSVKDSNYASTNVRDTGDYPLIICGLKIIGPDSTEFTLQKILGPGTNSYTLQNLKFPDTIQTGGIDSRTFGFNFTMDSLTGKVHYATLEIEYCDGSMDSIPLRATEAAQFVNLLTPQINFGTVRVGKSLTQPALFGNTATISLYVDTIWASLWPPSGAPNPFSEAPNRDTIPANSRNSVSVTFAPTVRGNFSGFLNANGGDFKAESIPITGIGAAPIPVLSTKKIDFGTIDLDSASNPLPLFLTDSGNWPIIVKIEKQNDKYDEFTVIMQSNATISNVGYDTVAVESSRSYTVSFTPKYPELPDHNAQLVFFYDDSTTDTVHLIGEDRSLYLAFDADTIDFGLVRVGTTPSPDTTVNIINTTGSNQTAASIQPPIAPFSMNPLAPIAVNSNSMAPIQVTFTPTALGFSRSSIVGLGGMFKSSPRDSVVIEGTGAAPDPVLSTVTLDFGTVAIGRTDARSFTLFNKGNWPLTVSCAPPSGNNPNDFTSAISSDTTIAAGDSATYTIQFLAVTPPFPQPVRTAQIIWTQDDGSTFTLDLIEHDVPALPVQIGFPHAYFGRPGDKIAISLDLQSAVPDTLGIQHLSGIVRWDPNIVTRIGGVEPGALVPTPAWSTVITYSQNGSFGYDISSTKNSLSSAGTLLNFTLQLNSDLSDGASTPLIALDTLPDTYEAIASEGQSSIFLDSNCGTIHLLDGSNPIANFIGQNSPNPFGGDARQTMLPFSVDADNTAITIQIFDATGREVLRPIDHVPFAQGRYTLPVNASSLSAGIYFYEFRANGEPPQMKKMAVE